MSLNSSWLIALRFCTPYRYTRGAMANGSGMSRSKPIPQELMHYYDHGTSCLFMGPQPNFGLYSADTRRGVFKLKDCACPESHRRFLTVDALVRAYERHGIKCLLCRACASKEAWCAPPECQMPSALERQAYAVLQCTAGKAYYMLFEVHVGRALSVDVLLVHKASYACIAVHVDGRQHLELEAVMRDAAFDAWLRCWPNMYVARLRQCEDWQQVMLGLWQLLWHPCMHGWPSPWPLSLLFPR